MAIYHHLPPKDKKETGHPFQEQTPLFLEQVINSKQLLPSFVYKTLKLKVAPEWTMKQAP